MSMRTSIIYGYGVPSDIVNDIPVSKILEGMKNYLPDIYQEMKKAQEEDDDEEHSILDEDFFEMWIDTYESSSESDEGQPLEALIADILSAKTGIRFSSRYEDNEACIMLEECMPWLYSSQEKFLTKELLDKMFQDFFQEMGVKKTIIPDFCQVEYYG